MPKPLGKQLPPKSHNRKTFLELSDEIRRLLTDIETLLIRSHWSGSALHRDFVQLKNTFYELRPALRLVGLLFQYVEKAAKRYDYAFGKTSRLMDEFEQACAEIETTPAQAGEESEEERRPGGEPGLGDSH